MTFVEAVARASQLLVDAGISPGLAARDADLLARHAAALDREAWLIERRGTASPPVLQRFDALIARRRQREPVAYIRGVQEFYGRDFIVSPSVLIPRPETELLVEHAIAVVRSTTPQRVVDVGTGSGCIAVTLAAELHHLTIFAVDVSADALHVAQQNAHRHGVADRVRFLHGAYLSEAPRPVDLILANPPYVAERDRTGLSPDVVRHEPAVALFGGADGWLHIRALLRHAAAGLDESGRLLMELGYGQSELVADEVAAVGGLTLEEIKLDIQGIPRLAVIARSHV